MHCHCLQFSTLNKNTDISPLNPAKLKVMQIEDLIRPACSNVSRGSAVTSTPGTIQNVVKKMFPFQKLNKLLWNCFHFSLNFYPHGAQTFVFGN